MTYLLHFPWPLLFELALVAAGGVALSRSRWGRQPLVLTRGVVVGAAWVAGIAISAAILVGQNAVDDLARERERRGIELAESVRRDQLTTKDVANISRRQALLDRPSEEQIARRVLKALSVIRRRPALRRQLARSLGVPESSLPPSTGSTAGVRAPTTTDTTTTRTPARRPPTRERTAPPAPASRGPVPVPAPSGGTANPPAAAPPSPGSSGRPAVNVTTPSTLPLPAVGVCTPVIGVNCP